MATFFRLSPEVAGGFGPESVRDSSVHPPKVTRLHYVFSGWDGDDLVESFPCYIVTDRLAHALDAAEVVGLTLADVLVTVDPQFARVFPDIAQSLPSWKWLVPTGVPWEADLWLDESAVLHVSDRFLAIADQFNLRRCEVQEALAP